MATWQRRLSLAHGLPHLATTTITTPTTVHQLLHGTSPTAGPGVHVFRTYFNEPPTIGLTNRPPPPQPRRNSPTTRLTTRGPLTSDYPHLPCCHQDALEPSDASCRPTKMRRASCSPTLLLHLYLCEDWDPPGFPDFGISGFGDSGFRGLRISRFQNFGISGFLDFEISRFWDFGTSGFRDFRSPAT